MSKLMSSLLRSGAAVSVLALAVAHAAAEQCPVAVKVPSNYVLSDLYHLDETGEAQVSKDWYFVTANEKTGLISADGKQVIEPKYDVIMPFVDGWAQVSASHNKWGYIDETGKEVLPLQYSVTNDFKDGVAAVAEAGDFANVLIDKSGKVVLKGDFDYVHPIANNRVMVSKNDLMGIVDYQGKEIIAPKYGYIESFNKHDLAVACENEKCGIIDGSGKVVVEPKYDLLFSMADGYYVSSLDEKWGLLNAKGEEVIPAQYDGLVSSYLGEGDWDDSTAAFVNDVIPAMKDEKWGLINKENKVVVPFEYEYILPVVDTPFVIVQKDEKMALLDSQSGAIKIPFEYVHLHHEGNALFSAATEVVDDESNKNNAVKTVWRLLDSDGKSLINQDYEYITSVNDELFAVNSKDGLSQLFNRKGEAIGDKWVYISSEKAGPMVVKDKAGKYGLINQQGEVVLSPRYDDVLSMNHGRLLVEQRGKTQLVDEKGCVLIEPEGAWKK